MKNGKNKHFDDENFIKNRRKRKNPEKFNKIIKKESKPHETAIIVSSILISLSAVFICLLQFVPGFSSFMIKHLLTSVSKAGYISGNVTTNPSLNHHAQDIVSDDGVKGKLDKSIYTFLATGTDFSGNLTDVIMIAKFDTAKGKTDILQIPRDTYVKVNGKLIIDDKGKISSENFSQGYGTKINSVYVTGKNFSKDPINNLLSEAKDKSITQIKSLCESKKYAYLGISPSAVTSYINETDKSVKNSMLSDMQRNFGIRYLSALIYYSYGIPIDYYAQVNTSGFRNIVDAIDGVDLYVPQNMYHFDPTQDLYINLKKGQQHLNGDKAEQFVRFRGYKLGDIDRIDAQKTFMNAFINKLFSISSVTKINDIISAVQANLYTNLTLQETAEFAITLLDTDINSGFNMITLPGGFADYYSDGLWISYYSANKDAVMELVNTSFNKYNTNIPSSMFGLHTITTSNQEKVESSSSDDTDKSDSDNDISTTDISTSDNISDTTGNTDDANTDNTGKTDESDDLDEVSNDDEDNGELDDDSTDLVTNDSDDSDDSNESIRISYEEVSGSAYKTADDVTSSDNSTDNDSDN